MPQPDPTEFQSLLERVAIDELGFSSVGVCPIDATAHAAQLSTWINDGHHGHMHYMKEHLQARLDPNLVLAGARSAICVADRYHDGRPDRIEMGAPPRGRVGRYARGDDYHRSMLGRLRVLEQRLRQECPGVEFRCCVDTAPVMERELAQRAGIGQFGKNTMLIEQGIGSWMLLGEILSTMEMPSTIAPEEDPCGSCTRCIDACPTDAITPYTIEATRCISYLTIEHRGMIDPELHHLLGDWIFGCDICQETCPHNQPTNRTSGKPLHPDYRQRNEGFDLLDVLGWSEQDRRDAFIRSALKRAKLDMFKRNAIICAGNAVIDRGDDIGLRRRLQELSRDPGQGELVRETARQTLDRIG
ncbi:MAG: tRNA epoxyqueuosine(34) reductase QueG [Phycisphaerae bacterium]|nr:tRNA epoxyqueuosine(34) reductase QueG [Phycisphaerae bacterium]